jgi:hypothetical protein
MISRSANSSSRNGPTSSRVAGPPRFIMTIPVLILELAEPVGTGGGDEIGLRSVIVQR